MINLILLYSIGFFIIIEFLLRLLLLFSVISKKYLSFLFTLVFCFIVLNFSTYLLAEVFEKITQVGGMTSQDRQNLVEDKIRLSYFVIAYFITDTILHTQELEFILHHIGGILYIYLHHQLDDIMIIIFLVLAEITNPLLISWRASRKSQHEFHFHISPMNMFGFIIIRIFTGLGLIFHTTLKYHSQSQSTNENILNWTIVIGFMLGHFYWAYKIIRNYFHLIKTRNNQQEKIEKLLNSRKSTLV